MIITLKNNIKCVCYPESSYGSLMVYTHYPEYEAMKFMEAFLTQNSNFIDIGAGFGDYSLLAASVINKGHILACEPLPTELVRLRENINLNELNQRIKILPVAISNKKGFINFTPGDSNELSHISRRKQQENTRRFQVKTTTIDALIEEKKYNSVDLIKIDVEGAETLVLEGANRSLKKGSINTLIVEFNTHQSDYKSKKGIDVISYLASLGYLTYKVQDNGWKRMSKYKGKRTQNVLIIKNDKQIKKRVKAAVKTSGLTFIE